MAGLRFILSEFVGIWMILLGLLAIGPFLAKSREADERVRAMSPAAAETEAD